LEKGIIPWQGKCILKALEIDPDFIPAMIYLATAFGNQGLYQDAKKWSKILYEKKNKGSRIENLAIEATYAMFFGTPAEVPSNITKCFLK
jgi:hypothetical protein